MKRALRTSAAAVLLAVLAACSKVTPGNYAKLQAGMTREQVHALLGAPDEVTGGGIGRLTISTEIWEGPAHTISVTFAGDQLTLRSIEPRRKP